MSPAHAELLNAGDQSNLATSKKMVLFSISSSEPCTAGLSRKHTSAWQQGRSQWGSCSSQRDGKPSGMELHWIWVFSNKQGTSHPGSYGFWGVVHLVCLFWASHHHHHQTQPPEYSRHLTAGLETGMMTASHSFLPAVN